MHPTISCRLTQARKAGLGHGARRAAWARAARRARPEQREQPGPRLHPWSRRVPPVLGAPGS
jgi:hypothetical protein